MLRPLEIDDFNYAGLEDLVARLGERAKQLIAATVAKKQKTAHIKILTEDVEKLKKAIRAKIAEG